MLRAACETRTALDLCSHADARAQTCTHAHTHTRTHARTHTYVHTGARARPPAHTCSYELASEARDGWQDFLLHRF